MSCFDDLMQFRDEVDRVEKNIQKRGKPEELKELRRRDNGVEEHLP